MKPNSEYAFYFALAMILLWSLFIKAAVIILIVRILSCLFSTYGGQGSCYGA